MDLLRIQKSKKENSMKSHNWFKIKLEISLLKELHPFNFKKLKFTMIKRKKEIN